MHILMIGIGHATAPLEVREKLSFSREQMLDALPMLSERVGGAVILSTCNRTEIYTMTDDLTETAREIRQFVSDYHGLDLRLVNLHLCDRSDVDAVRHLFRVTSGLESMILGEFQILGQVRNALTVASESHSLGMIVSRLFHRAIRTGRRVRNETDIGRNALSISYAGVRLAERTLGNLHGLKILLIGAGEAGQLVAGALCAAGASDLMITNRTAVRSEELARDLGGKSIPFSELGSSLPNADIVIAATEAPKHILTLDTIASAVYTRRERAMFLFDLSVPRNIDSRVASIDNVNLFNIDDLSTIAEENLQERKNAAVEAVKIIDEEIIRFTKWWVSLDAITLIKELRERAERIRDREMTRALSKLPDMSAEDIETLNAMTRSIINKLLHDPVLSLKRGASEAQLKGASNLLQLHNRHD